MSTAGPKSGQSRGAETDDEGRRVRFTPHVLIRLVVGALAAIVIAGVLALAASTRASATSGFDFTVHVTTKSGAALSGVSVYAIQVDNGLEVSGDPEPKASAVSKKPGYYIFSGANQLVSGPTYTLYFVPSGSSTTSTFSQLLGGASYFDRAQTFTVGTDAGSITSISTSLAGNAVITGKVTGHTGKPIKGATVESYNYDGSEWFDWTSAITNSKGVYTLDDLDPGSYKLEAYYPGRTEPPIFSGSAATFDDATAVVAGLDTVTTNNFAFPNNTGSISGYAEFSYYSSSGRYEGEGRLAKALPVAYPVTAEDVHGNPTAVDTDRGVYGARLSSKGTFSIAHLAPGDYVIELFPWYYNEAVAYLSRGSGSSDLLDADVYHVGTDRTYTEGAEFGITAQGSALTVTVTDSVGTPVQYARVLLQRTSDPDEEYPGVTNASGVVTFGKSGSHDVIRPGGFTITVSPTGALYEPNLSTFNLNIGSNSDPITLAPLIAEPGFTVAPNIVATSTEVGTNYVVTATPSRPDAVLEYQWMRNEHPIYGANGSAYTSRSADIGTQLSVLVTAESGGFDPVFATASVPGIVTDSTAVVGLVSPPTLSPSDGSTVHPGSVLDASTGTWDLPGLDFDYQWYVNDLPVSGDGSRFTVKADDIGQVISVQVSASRPGYTSPTPVLATNTVTPTTGDTPVALAPLVVTSTTSGVPKGSRSYTVAPGPWTGLDQEFHYHWRLDGNPVGGDSATYVETPTTAILAQPLTVEVTATVPGFTNTGSAFQLARKATAALTATDQPFATLTSGGSAVTSTSTVAYGQTLTVTNPGTWVGPVVLGSEDYTDSLTYTYQWYRATGSSTAKSISGATRASYTPTTGDVGYHLSFVETAHSSLWGSRASSRVAAGTVVVTSMLSDDPLSITVPTEVAPAVYIDPTYGEEWDSVGATTTYQWYLCALPSCTAASPTSAFTKISHATNNYYLPAAAEGGDRLFLEATGTKTAFATAHVSSDVIQIAPDDELLEDAPFITANNYDPVSSVTVGQTVYPHAIYLQNPDPIEQNAQFNYEWEVCSTDCTDDSSWTAPSGSVTNTGQELGASFTPDGADYANGSGQVRVIETVSEAGFQNTVVTSDPISIGIATYQLSGPELPSLRETAGDSDTSDTFTIVAPTTKTGVAPTYQWYVGDDAVAGSSVIVDDPSQAGTPVYAVLTYDLPGYTPFTEILVARFAVTPTTTPQVNSIVGSSYGETLTVAHPDPWGLTSYPGVSWKLGCMWCVNSSCETLYNDGSFTPSTYAIDKPIFVEITASSPLTTGTLLQWTPQIVLQQGAPMDPAVPPALSWAGDLLPGTPVSVNTPAYAVDGVATTYQWQLSSDDGATWQIVSGDTTDTFTPTLAEAGDQIRAIVTGTKEGYPDSVNASDAEPIQFGDIIQNLAAPALTGDPTVNGELSVDPGDWSHDVHLQVQWMLNGNPIPGATGSSYVPLASDAGDEISVEVTASRSDQLPVSAESNRMTIVDAAAPVAVTPPVISGLGTVSSPLIVTNGGWSVAGLTYTYQWSDQSGAIDGATTNSLVLPVGDVRADVSVTIKTIRFGYVDGSATAH